MSKNVKILLKSWEKKHRKSFTPYMILVLLSEKEMYGYEIRQRLEELSGNMIFQESSIYQVLKKFTKKGLVEDFSKKSPKGPDRKYYTLTEEGKILLEKYSEQYIFPTYSAVTSIVQKKFPDILKGDINA